MATVELSIRLLTLFSMIFCSSSVKLRVSSCWKRFSVLWRAGSTSPALRYVYCGNLKLGGAKDSTSAYFLEEMAMVPSVNILTRDPAPAASLVTAAFSFPVAAIAAIAAVLSDAKDEPPR